MTTEEYVKNIQNVSNEGLMEDLEICGHDGYYNGLYYPVIKELKRRLKYYEKICKCRKTDGTGERRCS